MAKGSLVHMDNLRFCTLTLSESMPEQIAFAAPYYLTLTRLATPEILHIPLSHTLKPPGAYTVLANPVTCISCRIETLPTRTIPALRPLWTFVLSQMGYLACGVVVPLAHMEDLIKQKGPFHGHGLGLICSTSRAFLALPL